MTAAQSKTQTFFDPFGRNFGVAKPTLAPRRSPSTNIQQHRKPLLRVPSSTLNTKTLSQPTAKVTAALKQATKRMREQGEKEEKRTDDRSQRRAQREAALTRRTPVDGDLWGVIVNPKNIKEELDDFPLWGVKEDARSMDLAESKISEGTNYVRRSTRKSNPTAFYQERRVAAKRTKRIPLRRSEEQGDESG